MKKCNAAAATVGKATVARTGPTSVKLFESERFKDLAWKGKGRRSMLWSGEGGWWCLIVRFYNWGHK